MPVFRSSLAVWEISATHVALGRWEARAPDPASCRVVRRDVASPPHHAGWRNEVNEAIRVLAAGAEPAGRTVLLPPPHLTLLKSLRVPRLSAAKREKVIHFEAAQAIPGPLDAVVWDYLAKEGAGDTHVLLCAVKRAPLEELCRGVELAGGAIDRILPGALAVRAVVRVHATAERLPAVFVELGAGSATLLLADSRQIHVRTVPCGCTAEADFAAERLAAEIARSAWQGERQFGLAPPQRIFLVGPSARRAEVTPALARKMNLPAADLVLPGTGPDVSVAMRGAWELAATEPRAGVDLRPPALRRRAEARRRQPWLAAAAALTVAALAFPLAHFLATEAEGKRQVAAADAALAPLRAREAVAQRQLARLAELREEVAMWQAVQHRRTAWVGFLADLQERLTTVEDVWLDRLQVLPAADEGGALRLAVSGRMLDKTNPRAIGSAEAARRVTRLFRSLTESPFVAAIESERFDARQPGVLRFDFVLVGRAAQPL
jgi:type IV pilus assembly protein PilM